MEGKYKILHDYGSDGWSFYDKNYDSANEALKDALSLGYTTKFVIVKVIDWEAVEKN